MFRQNAGAVGASGRIAPRPTMATARSCRSSMLSSSTHTHAGLRIPDEPGHRTRLATREPSCPRPGAVAPARGPTGSTRHLCSVRIPGRVQRATRKEEGLELALARVALTASTRAENARMVSKSRDEFPPHRSATPAPDRRDAAREAPGTAATRRESGHGSTRIPPPLCAGPRKAPPGAPTPVQPAVAFGRIGVSTWVTQRSRTASR